MVVIKPVQTLKKRVEQAVRSRLGQDQWALEYAAGRMTSIDALLEDIEGVVRQG